MIILLQTCLSNIWDNIFSQEDVDMVQLVDAYGVKLKVPEAGLLSNVTLQVEHYGKQNAIRLRLERSGVEGVEGVIDLDRNVLYVRAGASKTCGVYEIDKRIKIDISDMNNILRYATHTSRTSNDTLTFTLDMNKYMAYVSFPVIDIIYNTSTSTLSSIDVSLEDERIAFTAYESYRVNATVSYNATSCYQLHDADQRTKFVDEIKKIPLDVLTVFVKSFSA